MDHQSTNIQQPWHPSEIIQCRHMHPMCTLFPSTYLMCLFCPQNILVSHFQRQKIFCGCACPISNHHQHKRSVECLLCGCSWTKLHAFFPPPGTEMSSLKAKMRRVWFARGVVSSIERAREAKTQKRVSVLQRSTCQGISLSSCAFLDQQSFVFKAKVKWGWGSKLCIENWAQSSTLPTTWH